MVTGNPGRRRVPVLAVVLGDPAGIGPEVVAKALAARSVRQRACFVVVGDQRVFRTAIQTAGQGPEYSVCDSVKDLPAVPARGSVFLLDQKNLSPSDFALGTVSAACGKAVGQDLATAVGMALDGVVDGIVYGPLNKAALNAGGYDFFDEIHYLAGLIGLDDKAVFGEINKVGRLWLGRVTSHVGLKDVAVRITYDNVLRALRLTHGTIIAYGLPAPRILVAALNPHAGDGGLFGREEETIAKAIAGAEKEGINASGPYPADTVFLRYLRGEGEAIVAMYHDQGQIGAKLLHFDKAVTICAGLPLIAVTPAHGSGFELAGKGVASEKATREAFLVACQLASGGIERSKQGH